MLLGDRGSRGRCLLVWASGSSTLAVVVLVALPVAGRLWSSRSSLDALALDQALVDVAACVVLAVAAWAWLALTAVVAEVWTGACRPRRGARRVPLGVRRLILTACGVAVASSLASPAHADSGQAHSRVHGVALLSGLPLPDRAVAPPRHQANHTPVTVTVRAGDSLWAIARRNLPPDASGAAITARWRAIYDANRGVIGPDPDVIESGQRLHLPRKDRS